MVSVELTDHDAELFKSFRKYQGVWEKVFAIRGGHAELHFNGEGELVEVDYKTKEKLSTIK